ncbi:hypothetical protein M1271_03000 [Patescibacteria group bacterium]|nr:hypothetical protein [Patescibacteria group bacterium]MCL5798138.1 hypothetical protein [Patescibacteria group bacterium]
MAKQTKLDKSGKISAVYFISYILIGIIISFIYSVIVVYLLNPSVYRSIPLLGKADQVIFPLVIVLLDTFIASKMIKSKYEIEKPDRVALLSTIYVFVFSLIFMLPMLTQKISGIPNTRNLLPTLISSALEILLFYFFSSLFLRKK